MNSQEHTYHKEIMKIYKSHMTPKHNISPSRNSWSQARIGIKERDEDVGTLNQFCYLSILSPPWE